MLGKTLGASTLRILFPFARTQAALIPFEIRQLFGGGMPRGLNKAQRMIYRSESLMRGVIGQAVGRVVLNRVLGGVWPWGNDPASKYDLNITAVLRRLGLEEPEGRFSYIAFSSLDPGISRALRITGGNAAAEMAGRSEPALDFIGNELRYLGNQAAALLGPLVRVPWRGITGTEMYLTRSGVPMSMSRKRPTGMGQLWENSKLAFLASNPIARRVGEMGGVLAEGPHRPESTTLKFGQSILDVVGVRVKRGATETGREAASGSRGPYFHATIDDIARRASNEKRDHQLAFIADEVDELFDGFSDDEKGVAKRMIVSRIQGSWRGERRRLSRARAMESAD
jgi:hypothetical protein